MVVGRGEIALAHSHLLVQHLLKQLERYQARRAERDPRPAWLTGFIERAAACFSPFAGVGRVGCECEATEQGWEARFYLGAAEMVGGKEDGLSRGVSFELHLSGLLSCFTEVHDLWWNVAAGSDAVGGSFITVLGSVQQHTLCVKAYSRSPQHAGPGVRMHRDGRIEPVGHESGTGSGTMPG
uniref:Uncharacterized protein n=1 Tax=Schlesneria paludicola TaxID=360056 RepID=A0A7C4LPE0_9PLAN